MVPTRFMKKTNFDLGHLLTVIALALMFAVSYASLAIRKYETHQTRGDLTAYAQGLWNTVNGHFMASTFNYSVHNYWGGHFREITADNSNIFGVHFNPVILLFAPFYAVYPHPELLLIMQAVVLAGSSIIIFKIADDRLKNKLLALAIQFSYLLNLGIITAVLSEFHAYPLTVLFSALLIWGSQSKKMSWYYLWLGLLLLVQENAAIPALFFGFYLILNQKTRVRGVITAGVSIFCLLFITKLLIPQLSPLKSYMFETAYGSPLGGSYLEMITNSIRHPLLPFTVILSKANLIYLGKVFLPTLPLAFLAPGALLMSVMTLAPNLISSAGILKSQAMHYEAVGVPYSYFALILGVSNLFKFIKPNQKRWADFVVLFLILGAVLTQYKLLTGAKFSPQCVWSCRFYSALDSEKDQIIAAVPPGVSVSTQDYLSGHLSGREGLYLFPVYFDLADYVVISKGQEIWPLTSEDQTKYFSLLSQSPKHQVKLETDHFIIFQKIL